MENVRYLFIYEEVHLCMKGALVVAGDRGFCILRSLRLCCFSMVQNYGSGGRSMLRNVWYYLHDSHIGCFLGVVFFGNRCMAR